MSKIFVISGPSGSGKTTLLKELLKDVKLKRRLRKSVSLTTRPMRTGEKDGKDYFFLSKGEFLLRRKAKKILEWTKYLGYYYATPKESVDKALAGNKHMVLCLDSNGANYIKRVYPENAVTIFVAPPSLSALEDRIAKRCSRTKKDEIKKRLLLARKEMPLLKKYDYSIINDDLGAAIKQLKDVILEEMQH